MDKPYLHLVKEMVSDKDGLHRFHLLRHLKGKSLSFSPAIGFPKSTDFYWFIVDSRNSL